MGQGNLVLKSGRENDGVARVENNQGRVSGRGEVSGREKIADKWDGGRRRMTVVGGA